MQLHNLKRVTKNKKTMTVGRGGRRGKTAGRGTKGQNARAGRKKRPEMRDFIKRIPKLRGRGVNSLKSFVNTVAAINVGAIEAAFNKGDTISPSSLAEKNMIINIGGKFPKVKILGDGEITKSVIVSGCAVSQSAKAKLEKAGGSVK